MRIYLPASTLDLDKAADFNPHPSFDPSGRIGFAMTEKLRAANPELDQEELEWEAFRAAAEAAGAMLLLDEQLTPMRVVLSVDLPVRVIREPSPINSGPGSEISIPLSAIAVAPSPAIPIIAIHVDEPATAAAINKLRTNQGAADLLKEPWNPDLLWYDPSEIADIPRP